MLIEQQSAPLFFKSVFVNAIFSGMCGVMMATLSIKISATIGYAHANHVFWIGVFLIIFSAGLFFVAWSKRIRHADAIGITSGDFLWVIASIYLLMTNAELFNKAGLYVVTGVAAVVFVFAELQTMSLLRFRRKS